MLRWRHFLEFGQPVPYYWRVAIARGRDHVRPRACAITPMRARPETIVHRSMAASPGQYGPDTAAPPLRSPDRTRIADTLAQYAEQK
ncbi:MAG: hypothetical protein WBB98_00140 [Xanthobacteraceae bacterium]